MRFGRWRRVIVEVSIGASAVALAFAAIQPTAEPIVGAVVLVGIALLVELDATLQPARELGPQPLWPPVEPEPARPESQGAVGFRAAIVDATSV